MPRPIHPIPTVGLSSNGGIAPVKFEDLDPRLGAASTNYTTATHYAALACDNSGALIIPDGPIQPVCSLGSIDWPKTGYYVTINPKNAATDPGKLTAEVNASGDTIAISYYKGTNATSSKLDFLTDTVAGTKYFPRINRRKTLSNALLAALPENTPRAGYMPTLGKGVAGAQAFISKEFSYTNYLLKAERREAPGLLLSFPLIGVQRVRIIIGYEFTYSGSRMHRDGAISIPLRACFVPVVGDKRLTHWPEWPSTLNFDAEYSPYYGSGLVPTQTCSLEQTLYALGTSEIFYTEWELDVPPSGLGLFWTELDPFQYFNFASKMIHAEFDTEISQQISYIAEITQAIALP